MSACNIAEKNADALLRLVFDENRPDGNQMTRMNRLQRQLPMLQRLVLHPRADNSPTSL